MHTPVLHHPPRVAALLLTALLAGGMGETANAQAVDYRGLWVGQVTLTRANEVTVALDEDNVPIAPKPNVATPTADAAHLRLILHVNGAGQVNLLKDVAILDRASGSNGTNIIDVWEDTLTLQALSQAAGGVEAQSDASLVTDERLYTVFPAQPAVRIASAVYDFGDSRASDAVHAVLEAAAGLAAQSVFSSTENLSTTSGRLAAETAATAAALDNGTPGNAQSVVDNADVANAFILFMGDHLPTTVVTTIAEATDPATDMATQTALTEATNLMNASFYQDTRGIDLVHSLVLGVQTATNATEKLRVAHNVAASYADVTNSYQRFISSKQFGDMITAAADAAAAAAVATNATSNTVTQAVQANTAVNDVKTDGIRLTSTQYDDTRPSRAIDQVLKAVIDQGVARIGSSPILEEEIAADAAAAGRGALDNDVERFPIPARAPTLDYSQFVSSQAFRSSATTAAEAAAAGAVSEKLNNGLFTQQSIEDAARVAAVTALDGALDEAALAVRTELPLEGGFGPGQGDPRLTFEIDRDSETLLGSPGLIGVLYLPANHPTNPFRHRRHPDHTRGFDIRRHIRLDFDGDSGDALERAGFGVDRITGIYREEIFGLHKPLGPQPVTQPIGLKVEGAFELNRISLIDTLNAL